MTQETPDYTDADFVTRSIDRPKRRSPVDALLTPRAILGAVGELLAEQRNAIAALQARVEALERADPASLAQSGAR